MLLALVLALVGTVGPVWMVRAWCFTPFRVPSASMAPTLAIGDHVIAWRSVFQAPLERGTIVAFRYPEDRDVTYLKRVIGLPGDELTFENNRPVIPGVPVTHGEPTPAAVTDDACDRRDVKVLTETIGGHAWTIAMDKRPSMLADSRRVTVPPGHVYVVGDNRDHSMDSRLWGFVPIDDVIGTVDRVWFSFDPCASRSRPERVGPVR